MTVNIKSSRVFLRPGFTDMRKQINGLASIVTEHMKNDPLDGSLYLFLGKTRRTLKVLYWDETGFCLWIKRLELYKFPWPKEGESATEINKSELAMLLKGIDFFNAHKEVKFTKAC